MRGAFLLALLLAGCGGRAPEVNIHDPRLPVEARQWLADAQDAVVITRAGRDEARTELDAVRRWGAEVAGVQWPAGGAGVTAQAQLAALGEARLTLARLRLAAADRAIGLAEARLDLIAAETAMRHDLAVYDLAPLRQRTESAATAARAASADAERQREVALQAATAWWTTYGQYVASGGDPGALWRRP